MQLPSLFGKEGEIKIIERAEPKTTFILLMTHILSQESQWVRLVSLLSPPKSAQNTLQILTRFLEEESSSSNKWEVTDQPL